MLFKNPRRLLSEAATADLLNPEVSDEVKDTVVELEDILTNNVEEVKEEDKTTNGGIPVTTESVAMLESAVGYGKAKYLISLESVIAVMESEGEAAAAAEAEPGEAPTEEAIEAAEPSPVNVVEDIAEKNGVEPEQVAVVISSESVRFLAEMSILESKAGKNCKKTAAKKAKKVKDVVEELKGKVKLVKA